MPTETQKAQLLKRLKEYKRKYLVKRYRDLDESATRLMINSFLTEVLDYTELDEIKTEYIIKGTYADYVIQMERKKHFIVEVKAIQLDLSEKHMLQALNYAANEGVDWILLTNGKQLDLYRVIFGKPINARKVFGFDLSDKNNLKESVDYLIYLTKRSVQKGELESFWARFQALEPNHLHRYLYAVDVVRFLRRTLKKKTGLSFSEQDILESLHHIITHKIESSMPKTPISTTRKRRSAPAPQPQEVMEKRIITQA